MRPDILFMSFLILLALFVGCFRHFSGLYKVLGSKTTELASDQFCITEDSLDIKVGKYQLIDSVYKPIDLVLLANLGIPTAGQQYLRQPAGLALKKLEDNLSQELGLTLYVISSYRSASLQEETKRIFENLIGKKSDRRVADPGHSEHQLGTTVDFSLSNGKLFDTSSREWQWLANNTYKYGFVMSYGPENQTLSGFDYEPWHWRYVGEVLAGRIKNSGQVPQYFYREKGCYIRRPKTPN